MTNKPHVVFLTKDQIANVSVIVSVLLDGGSRLSLLGDLELSDEFRKSLEDVRQKLDKKLNEISEGNGGGK